MVVKTVQLKKTIAIGGSDPDYFRDTDFAYLPIQGFLNIYGVSSVADAIVSIRLGATEVVQGYELNIDTKINKTEDQIAELVPVGQLDKLTASVINNNAAANDVRLKLELHVF